MRNDQAVLSPYTQGGTRGRPGPLSLIVVAAFSVLTGMALAILPSSLYIVLAIPIFLGIALALWLLPDGGFVVPTGLMIKLLIGYLCANCLWPSYIALNLPGLPWVNPQRLVLFPLAAIGVYTYSASSTLRANIRSILHSQPWTNRLFWTFWLISLMSLALSSQPVFSLTKWLNNQVYWTFLFVSAAWLGSKPAVVRSASLVLVITAFAVSVEGMYELHIGMIPWALSIPQWLIGEPELVATILKPHSRAGTDIYRVTSTFNVSLTFAEYLAIVYPLALHCAIQSKHLWRRLLVIAGLVAMLIAMWITNSRSAMIGFFMSILIYGGLAALRNWRTNRSSLIHAGIMAMLPVLGAVFLVLALTWPRLHNMTFGGAQHQPSSAARDAQWEMAIPKVLRNPFGYGVARGATTLGYRNAAGIGTIDTYYVNLLLEYGVVGFAVFMAMIIGQAIAGVRTYLSTTDLTEMYSGPLSVSLINFLVIKSVSSSEFNIPLIFVLSGFLFSIAYLRKIRLEQGAIAVRPSLIVNDGAGSKSVRPARKRS